MNHRDEFARFLKRRGKNEHVVDELIEGCVFFEKHLSKQGCADIDHATKEDITRFIQAAENERRNSKNILRALALYYHFQSRTDLSRYASSLREKRIAKTRSVFKLSQFRDADSNYIDCLQTLGIENVQQMLQAGRTPRDRALLSKRTGIPVKAILELVKLSDLSRLGGLKTVRARLYLQAGVDTPDKIARWEPEKLRAMFIKFVGQSGFNGIAPLPKEVCNTVAKAKVIEKIVEYD